MESKWKKTNEYPKPFEKVVIYYDGQILFGTFKDRNNGKSYREYVEDCKEWGRAYESEELYNFERYYVDRVDFFGSVDWDDVMYWVRIPELPKTE